MQDGPGTQGYINIYLSWKPQIVLVGTMQDPEKVPALPPPPSFNWSHYVVLESIHSSSDGPGPGSSLGRCVIRGERGLECTDSCLNAAHSTVRSVGVWVNSQTPFYADVNGPKETLSHHNKGFVADVETLLMEWLIWEWLSSQMRGVRDWGMYWLMVQDLFMHVFINVWRDCLQGGWIIHA